MNAVAVSPDIEVASASLVVPTAVSALRRVRAFTRESLRHWGEDGELLDVAVLIVCELATNAICHGADPSPGHEGEREPGPDITLLLALHRDTLHIEVRDASPVPPARRTAGLDSDSGRGLMIIEALSESWTSGRIPDGGKWVRACLRRVAGALTD